MEPICTFGANCHQFSTPVSQYHTSVPSCFLRSNSLITGAACSQCVPWLQPGINQVSFHPGHSRNHYSSPASQTRKVQSMGVSGLGDFSIPSGGTTLNGAPLNPLFKYNMSRGALTCRQNLHHSSWKISLVHVPFIMESPENGDTFHRLE